MKKTKIKVLKLFSKLLRHIAYCPFCHTLVRIEKKYIKTFE